MSDDNKSPFNEKTVVQTRDRVIEASPDTDRTVIHAKNVPSLPKEAPAPMPAASNAKAKPETAFQAVDTDVVEAAAKLSADAELTPTPEKKSSRERRKRRDALDRRSRMAFVGFVMVCCAAVVFVMMNRGTSSTEPGRGEKDAREMASEVAPPPPEHPRVAAMVGGGSTTDVLAKFDRASSRARERALDAH